MKKVNFVLSFLFALALSLPALGQATLTGTTLAAAATSSATTLQVASATGITANSTLLYIFDGTARGEAVFVNSVSSKTLKVTRGYHGTSANGHISGALVLLGPPNYFYSGDPSGACTLTSTLVTPYVNIKSGRQWLCSSVTNSWVPGFFNDSGIPGDTLLVASAAGATAVSGPQFHVNGTNAITAWGASTSAGSLGMGGSATDVMGAPFCVIPDAAFTTTATNNIAKASTAVANKPLCFTFDQTNKKYVPSY
jgi:hypothetical protein